jgi:hypothetical protein
MDYLPWYGKHRWYLADPVVPYGSMKSTHRREKNEASLPDEEYKHAL